MATAYPTPSGPNPSLPAVFAEEEQTLLAADTATTASFLSAGIIDVAAWRELTLFLAIDGAAALDRLGIIVMVSNAAAQPLATDDSWYIPVVTDGSVTAGAGGGAVPASFDYTLLPADWGVITVRQGEYRFSAFGGATEELRPAISFAVSRYRWAQVLYNDGGGATRCAVGIKYARTC